MDRSPRPRLAEATEAELGRTISCELYCYLNTERSVAEARRCFQRGTRKNKRNGSQNPHGTWSTATVFPTTDSTLGLESKGGERIGEVSRGKSHRTCAVL